MELTLSAIEPNIITQAKINQTMSQVGTALLSNEIDTAETLGDSMTRMMENSVNPAIGGNIDVSV